MNKHESARIVAVIVAACPNQGSKLDSTRLTAMVDAFTALLADMTYEQVNAAVTVLLQTSPWMPAVADIRSTALELARGPVGAGGEAWGRVLRAVSMEGSYRSPGVDFVFADPVTARCVAAFGWQQICLSENAIADRARFIDMYDQLAVQDRREQQSPLLAAAKEQRSLAAGNADALVGGLVRRLTSVPGDEP